MVKVFKPVTAGTRNMVIPTLLELDIRENQVPKSLFEKRKRMSARNHSGRITCRHKGGAHKKRFRVIDFKRDKENIPARVASIEYDPNRSSLIALLNYADGEKRFVLAWKDAKVGATVSTSDKPPFENGCCMKLKHMPIGAIVHNIELHPGRGAQLIRSAGGSAQILGRSGGFARIRMPSKEVRLISEECKATFGAVSNAEHNQRVLGKAGRARWMGIRPTVRGMAMNPVDHPMGGGEGRSKGHLPQSPWSQLAKGYRTRHPKTSRKMIVKERR